MTTETKPSARDTFLRVVAVLGLIAILLLGAWGIIELALALPNTLGGIGGSVSSLFTKNAQEAVVVSVPANATPGQAVAVAWNHQNKTGINYSYTLSFACQTGLTVKAPAPNGSYQTVACNTPFNYVNATAHMTLVPTLSKVASAPLAITVTATRLDTGVVTAQGSATTNVGAAAATQPTQPVTTNPAPTTATPSTPSGSYYPAPSRPAMYGWGDLSVQINSVQPYGSLTRVVFTVANTGTNVINSGWVFSAQLPINGGYTYNSVAQRALYPGDKIVYTLSFQNTGSYNQNNYSVSQYQYQSQNGYGYSNSYNTGYNQNYPATNYTCNAFGPCINNGVTQYPNYNQNGYHNGSILITVDPWNVVQEITKANNQASAGLAW